MCALDWSGADLFALWRRHLLTNFARRRHRFDGGAHDLRGARPARFVGRFRLEQLCMTPS
jgi:hypothetical protein